MKHLLILLISILLLSSPLLGKGKNMVKEQTLRLMEESMKEDGRLEKDMVKGH